MNWSFVRETINGFIVKGSVSSISLWVDFNSFISLATLYFSSKLHLRHVVNTIVSKEIYKCLYEFFPLVPIVHSLSLYLA